LNDAIERFRVSGVKDAVDDPVAQLTRDDLEPTVGANRVDLALLRRVSGRRYRDMTVAAPEAPILPVTQLATAAD